MKIDFETKEAAQRAADVWNRDNGGLDGWYYVERGLTGWCLVFAQAVTALGLKGDRLVTKIERTCPRCHKRLYQWIIERLRGSRIRIECADCAHRWNGRQTIND